jgi:hypothetical protein
MGRPLLLPESPDSAERYRIVISGDTQDHSMTSALSGILCTILFFLHFMGKEVELSVREVK